MKTLTIDQAQKEVAKLAIQRMIDMRHFDVLCGVVGLKKEEMMLYESIGPHYLVEALLNKFPELNDPEYVKAKIESMAK